LSVVHNTAAAPTVPNDERLLVEIASGNNDAFEQFYRRFYASAYRVARSVCHDTGRAEDAVQDAFTAVWRTAGSYRSERGSVSAWLLSLVRYRAIDVARANTTHARKRADEDDASARAVAGAMADEVVERDSAARLKTLLSQLPDAQREVVTLAFYGQLTHAEIAAKLDLPSGTVKGRMRLGLRRLRANVNKAGTSERLHTALSSALRNGDLDGARRVVREATREMPAVTMLDDVLAPAMHSIGKLWRAAEITVADEHLATTICDRLLAEISAKLQTAHAKSRETVLLITPAPERHTLGLRMAGAVLYGAGYDTLLLGSGVPEEALKGALLRHRPTIVALSSSMPRPAALAATANLIHGILPAAHLITGGATARQLPANITAHHVERLDLMLSTVDAVLRRVSRAGASAT
jgi:RNA polymerase sigma-70 factor (ECF subfamily)